MPRKSIELSLDLMKRNSISQFIVKQLDDVTLEISLFENNKMYDISNATTRLFVGTNNDLYMQDSDIVISENKATIKLDRSILQDKGCAYAELEITDSNGSVATPSFLFDIDKRVSEGLKGNIEGFVEKYERLIAEFRVQVNNAVMDNYNRTTTAISVFETNGNVVIGKIKSDGENAISTFNTNASNKLAEYENRFQKLTASQQQDAEVVDARDGEMSLKARLDRDLAKGKIIEETVSENYITVKDSVDGSITDIEILGNTVQSVSDLSDIQSVGTLQEDGRYKMSILSCGKNLFDINKFKNLIKLSDGYILSSQEDIVLNVKSNTKYILSSNSITYEATSAQRLFDIKYLTSSGEVIGSSVIITEGNRTTTLTTPSNCKKLLFTWWWNNNGKKKILSCQLEEGTVATTYEPYQYNKSSILLPCQLEKIGNVSDRLFRRQDGVWCIEKNIGETVFNGGESWITDGSTELNNKFRYVGFNGKSDLSISNLFMNASWDKYSTLSGSEIMSTSASVKTIHVSILKTRCPNLSVFKALLNTSNLIVKYQLATPQIIELPLDTQIQLNTFAETTHIFTEDTVIEPTIKATVAKSLASSVKSINDKTDEITQRLSKVETLQEGNDLEVFTDHGNVIIENTNNGYVKDFKLEGNTLVNLSGFHNWVDPGTNYDHVQKNTDGSWLINPNKVSYCGTCFCKAPGGNVYDPQPENAIRVVAGKTYTLGIKFKEKSIPVRMINLVKITDRVADLVCKSDTTTINNNGIVLVKFTSEYTGDVWLSIQAYDTNSYNIEYVMLMEGEYDLSNMPEYFEGLKSVGDGVDKIEVLSCNNGNLVNPDMFSEKGLTWTNGTEYSTTGKWITDFIEVFPKTILQRDMPCILFLYDKNKQYLGNERVGNKSASSTYSVDYLVENDVAYIKVQIHSESNKTMYLGFNQTLSKPCEGNKKQILYQNSDGVYEKPILRSTGSVSDTIEKHSDGKYYYHKRCGEVVLDNNFTVSNVTGLTDVYVANITIPNMKYISGTNNTLSNKKFINSTDRNSNNVGNYIIISTGIQIVCPLDKNTIQLAKDYISTLGLVLVYQLATEEVYECINLDLDSYEGETSIIVDSGAISPKLSFKIASHIGNTISVLKDRINYLEDKVINMFKAVLAGDVQTLAYELYPEDFENNDITEEVETVEDTSVIKETVEDAESL